MLLETAGATILLFAGKKTKRLGEMSTKGAGLALASRHLGNLTVEKDAITNCCTSTQTGKGLIGACNRQLR